MLFLDVKTGQGKFIVINMDDLNHFGAGGVVRWIGTFFGEHLHKPDQTEFMVCVPIGNAPAPL